jgi:hypothetical protein
MRSSDGLATVRIGPPGGVAATDEMSVLDLIWLWLRARIAPPTG